MSSINQKFLIKRNILLFKHLYDKVMKGIKVRIAIQEVADEYGYTYGVVRDVYYNKSYAHSPFEEYHSETGEVLSKRTTEEILEEANKLITEGFTLQLKETA